MKFIITLINGEKINAEFVQTDTIGKVWAWINQKASGKFINIEDKLLINGDYIIKLERADETKEAVKAKR